MGIDSSRPLSFRVVIDDGGLGGTAPADGFIDPTIVGKHMDVITVTGTQANPTVSDGDSIQISGITISFLTGALNLAGIIDTINALTEHHHAVATASGGSELVLTNEAMFEGNAMTVTGDDTVLTALGIDDAATVQPKALPTNLVTARAKARANIRWKMLTQQITRDSSPLHIGAVDKIGGDVDTAPSEISFAVTYANLGHVITHDELDSNESVLEGIVAIRRMAARALLSSRKQNFDIVDPTITAAGSVIGMRIEEVEVGELTSSLATAEAAITVSVIPNNR